MVITLMFLKGSYYVNYWEHLLTSLPPDMPPVHVKDDNVHLRAGGNRNTPKLRPKKR